MALIDNIVSYWKMDETSGTREDAHSTNDLTANGSGGIGSATGIINNGADLELSDVDYLNRAAQTWGIANAQSYSYWYKPESITGNNRLSFMGPAGGANQLYIILLTSGKINVQVRDSAGALIKDYTGDTVLSTGNWYHIVVTWDGTNLVGYVNNTSQTWVKNNDNSGTMTDTSRTFFVGATPSGTAPADGVIDEFGLWSRALTGAEVTSLYNSGAGLAYPFTGTTVKSYNAATTATVKTVLNGTAIANRKTWNSIT